MIRAPSSSVTNKNPAAPTVASAVTTHAVLSPERALSSEVDGGEDQASPRHQGGNQEHRQHEQSPR